LGNLSVLLFVGIMQKPLNTHLFSHAFLLRGIRQLLFNSKATISTVLVLVLSALSIGSAAAADSDFTSNLVYISGSNTNGPVNRKFYTPGTASSNGITVPFTIGTSLGTFNRNTTVTQSNELYISGVSNTTAGTDETVAPPTLFYRIYRKASSEEERGGFIPLQLAQLDGSPTGNANWSSPTTSLDLIQSAATPGDYLLEVYFQAVITVAGATANDPSTTANIFDGSDSNPYNAAFQQTIDDKQFVRRTWSPQITPNGIYKWSDANNWSPVLGVSQVPNSSTDVVIPRNTTNSYPTIDISGATVHDITLSGNPRQPTQKASLLHISGQLTVSGNFQDPYGGYAQSEEAILSLNGTDDQVFDASSRVPVAASLFNLVLTGAGKKYATSNIDIKSALNFGTNVAGTAGTSGPLVTGNFSVDLGESGRIVNETKESFVDGTVTSTRTINNNEFNNFGNIGIAITANRDNVSAQSPGKTVVTRYNYIYFGEGTSESISRGFQFLPAKNDNIQFDLEFKYLNSELNNIPVSNLRLFRSANGDIPFEALGSSTTSSPNTFTKVGLTGSLAALFTLGDGANPLPVTLVSFTATPTAQGAALLRWTTAIETNNKGFGIERQLGKGEAWQPVGYLTTGNNASGSTYEYTDKSLATATPTPQAYYRLRQEDLDGKVNYSPVAVIARSAAAASTALQLSPVPVTGSTISLTFAEMAQAGAEIAVMNTQGQRLFSQTTQASSETTAISLPVERLAAGVYIVTVRVPGQAVRHARFVKL
jgi:hypothetical protein